MHRTREGEAHLSLLTQTILVQALAHAALAKGYTVRFTTLVAGLADLSRQESVPVLERGLRRYTRVGRGVLRHQGPTGGRAAGRRQG
jgi:hypothetical protein